MIEWWNVEVSYKDTTKKYDSYLVDYEVECRSEEEARKKFDSIKLENNEKKMIYKIVILEETKS